MKQILIFLLGLFSFICAFSQGAVIMQDKSFRVKHTKDSSLLKAISKERSYASLSEMEKEVLYWVGVLRKNPQGFRTDVVKPFLAQFPELHGGPARSLDKDLAATEPLSILLPAENLGRAASSQASFLSESGRFSHIGPRGRTFQQRMLEVGVKSCAGENLFEGKADALVALMLLLIDNGVEGYGHRKALLNPAFSKVGIGVVTEEKGTMMMVQVFSCN